MSAKRLLPVVLAVTATATIYVGGQAALASPASSVKGNASYSGGVPSSSSSEGSCAAGSSAPASSGWSNPFSSASSSPCVYIPGTGTYTEPPASSSTSPVPSHSVEPSFPPAKPAVPVTEAPAYTG